MSLSFLKQIICSTFTAVFKTLIWLFFWPAINIAPFQSWLPLFACGQRNSQIIALPLDNIFYATLPPARLIDAMDSGKLLVGNFWFDVRPDALWPDVFMTNTAQHARLSKSGYTEKYSIYTRNRGMVLLVKAGNPKHINGIADLLRADVNVAISAPTEPASANSYIATLKAQGGAAFADKVLAKPGTVLSRVVHHRENPQFIADGLADVAPMYFHFGDYLKKTFPQLFDYVVLPKEGNTIEELSIAKIKSAPHPQAAAAWIDFIRTDIAADIFTRNGFDYANAAERNREVIPQ
ncbi:MAG: glycine/betaine transporter substrate-binding protein [Verrucomicrobiaceae bacterium]|nr:glycine/betaine transporter substrate-binding protein [Verrucomicrobiaceae bacterium]